VHGVRRTLVFFIPSDPDDDSIATAHGVEIVEQEEGTRRSDAANPAGKDITERPCISRQVTGAAANDPYFEAAINAAKTRAYRAAVSAGLTTADREDLYQEILLDLLERAAQYDPSRGSPGTFTGMVSEHRTADFLTALKKDRGRMGVFSDHGAANDDDATPTTDPFEAAVPMWADDIDLFSDTAALHDMATALDFMTDEQAGLLHLLEAHLDLPSAAKASGLSSATFYRRVADLQMHLRMFGIKTAA
jgi:DNA-directed RNA polymerase specialized sigma24 family protein